ncbi:MAG: MFS transporter [Brevinematia bacterium]
MAENTIEDIYTEKKRCESARNVSIMEGFLQTIGINIGGVFLPSFISTSLLLELKAPLSLIGFVNSLLYLVNVLQPLSTGLTRNIKRRKPLVVFSSFLGRALFITSMFTGLVYSQTKLVFPIIILILCFASFSISFAGTGWSTWMADIVPEEKRGSYFGLRNSICSIAGIFAVLLAGFILKFYPGRQGYFIIYSIALFSAIVGSVALWIQYEPKKNESYDEPFFASYKNIISDRNFIKFVAMVSFFNFALLLANPFFNVYYLDYLKITPQVLSYFAALGIIIGIIGYIFFGKISEITGYKFIIKICLFFMAFPAIIVNFVTRDNFLILVSACVFLQSFFGAGWTLATFNTSLSISPMKNRSLYIAVFNSINSFFAIFASVFGGYLSDLLSGFNLFIFGRHFYPTFFIFISSAFFIILGLLLFPEYREADRKIEVSSIRDVILRPDFASVLYRIFLSSFIQNIPSRTKLAEDIGDTKASIGVIPLSKLLNDLDHEVRISAIRNIGKIPTFQAFKVLESYYRIASYLEKKEILSVFANFNFDECRRFLLKVAETTPHKTLKMEALHSLSFMVNSEVKKLALSSIVNEKDINFFFVYLEILARGKVLEALPIILKKYSRQRDRVIKNQILFYISILLDLKKDFYGFCSIENYDDQERLLLNLIKKVFKHIVKSLKDHSRIKARKMCEHICFDISQRKLFNLKPFERDFFNILSSISLNLNVFVHKFLLYFFKKESLNILEMELVFLELSYYFSLMRKIRK